MCDVPRVSVIIPCYNHAHYLGRAVQSVLAQTYADWEAVIVDDGSTDNTATVAAQFTDPRIRYIYQPNQGLSAARNTGIRAAHGEFLALLDADDEWEAGLLQRGVAVLDSNESLAGVYTRNLFIGPDESVLPQMGGRVVSPADFRRRLLEGGFFPPSAVLVRMARIQEVGLFDTALTSLEDWDLWLRISAKYPMQGIAEPLLRYRLYPGSMSTNASRMHANRVAVLTKWFGPPEGDPDSMPEEKRRAYGFAYWCSCIGYLQAKQPDEAWRLLTRALSLWPGLVRRLDTFYELACADKPWGYRGQADLLDIESSGDDMLKRLEHLVRSVPALASVRGVAWGNAHLALGLLSDQAGHWSDARRYLICAIRANPRFLGSWSIIRRFLKLCAGQRLTRLGKSFGGRRRASTISTRV